MLMKLIFSLSFLKGFKTATAHSLTSEYSTILKEVAGQFHFKQVPEVFSSYAVESPITVGLKQISVIIPENLLSSMSDDEFKSVLYHEFADLNYKLNEAISVAESFLETSKEKDVLLSANRALASAYMYKKQYDLALKYGRKKGCEVELIDIIHAINDEKYDEEELEALDRCNFKSWAKRVYRRLHLINKLRTPEEAIKNFNNLAYYAKVRTELLYEKCKALIKLNRQEEASLIISGLTKQNRYYYNFKIVNKKEREKIIKGIKELKIRLQKYHPHLKEFKELIKISPKYVLYIQPLGPPDITAIKKAVPIIEEHFGCRVKILPRLPMPNDPYCFKREKMKYHAYHVVLRT